MPQTESSVSFTALGGLALVAVSDAERQQEATAAVRQVVHEFDLACSRFRQDSELCALNAAAGRHVRVSPLLFEAVQEALRAAHLSGGAVDPTIGAALVALGYDRDFEQLRPPRGIDIVPVAGWRAVQVDGEASTVRLPSGVALDLGATAKALAADRAAAAAHEAAGCGVLVSLSGDLAIAGPAHRWRIRVTEDHQAGVEAPGQWITLRSGGLATSSTTVRRWPIGDDEAHHLIDPRTSRPVSARWRTASVCAASCLDANIASTASIIRGEEAEAWLERSGLPSRLVGADGRVRHLAGWPAEGDDLAEPRQPTPVFAGASLR
jgi:thiamine biosynthesis lipoprotein